MNEKWECDEWLDDDEAGEEEASSVICQYCHAEIDDESIHCPVCGRLLVHAAPWANRSAPVQWLMKLVVVLLLATMLIPLLIWWL